MAQKDRDHVRRLREEANAIRRQEQAAKRRRRVLTQLGIIGGAIIVIGLIIVGVIYGPALINPKAEYASSGTIQITSTVTGETTDEPISTIPTGAVSIGAVDAPVTIDLYYDFSCPHCIDYHTQTASTFTDLVATGQVKVNYHAINYVAPYGREAGAVIMAVAQHQPDQYINVLEGLYSIPAQTQSGWTKSDYATALPQLGVTNQAIIDDVERGAYRQLVLDATNDARNGGVNGTPSVWINGVNQETLPMAGELYDLSIAAGAKIDKPAGSAAA